MSHAPSRPRQGWSPATARGRAVLLATCVRMCMCKCMYVRMCNICAAACPSCIWLRFKFTERECKYSSYAYFYVFFSVYICILVDACSLTAHHHPHSHPAAAWRWGFGIAGTAEARAATA